MHKSKKQRIHDKRIIMAIRNTCKELNKDKTAYKYVVVGKHAELFKNIPKLRMRGICKARNTKMVTMRVLGYHNTKNEAMRVLDHYAIEYAEKISRELFRRLGGFGCNVETAIKDYTTLHELQEGKIFKGADKSWQS